MASRKPYATPEQHDRSRNGDHSRLIPFAPFSASSYPYPPMHWIDTLERRFGHLAIPHLIRVVVFFNAFVWILVQVNPQFVQVLTLDPALVRQGQLWRLVSYIFIPPATSFLWIAFALMFFWMLGDGLEEAWGAFRVNLFYLIGMMGTTIAALLTPGGTTNIYLNLSILFAFATIYPNHEILLFFILPLKIKWLAWFSLGFLMLRFFSGSFTEQAVIAAAFANYAVFFGRDLWELVRHRRALTARRQQFARAAAEDSEPLHRCAICRRTDETDPDLEFRVSADDQEYCVDHLPARNGS